MQHKTKNGEHFGAAPARHRYAQALAGGQFFYTGRELYPALAECIRGAREEILLNTYTFDYDAVGAPLIALLRERAAAGVRVRLIFDALESAGRGKLILETLAGSGVEVRAYRPMAYLRKHPVSFLYRDHARLFLIDRKILGVGGMGIGEIYNDRRDLFILLPVTRTETLVNFFEELWQAAEGLVATARREEKPEIAPGVLALISGPEQAEQEIYTWRMAAIGRAKRRIAIVSSFFFPTREMIEEIIAAKRRGVVVTVVTPFATDKGRYDSFRSMPIAPLLAQGITWYATPFYFHAKFMLCDDDWNVGSANCDVISMKRNYELDLAGTGGPARQASPGDAGGPILARVEEALRAVIQDQTPRTTQPNEFFFGYFSRILYWLFEFFFTAAT